MGICGTKSKEHRDKNKSNGEKYQEKETNDNNHCDVEDYVIPSDFEQKIEFLCSQKLNKHIRMRSSDNNFFYKVIVESNITNHNELDRAITYVRDKIKLKNESILRNFDTKGSTCIQVISDYQTKIKDLDYKGILAMCLQDKCTDNQIPPLIEKVFSLSLKCYQIVLTILLCSGDQESIEKWWNINKDNINLTEEFSSEIKDLNKQLTLKNEQHQQTISMLASRRVTLQKPFLNDELNNIASNQVETGNKQDENVILKEMAVDYLSNLYGSVSNTQQQTNEQPNSSNQPTIKTNQNNSSSKSQQQLDSEQISIIQDTVSTYLQKLWKNLINEVQFSENIQDMDQDNDHKASACVNYSIGLDIKKKSTYLSRKD